MQLPLTWCFSAVSPPAATCFVSRRGSNPSVTHSSHHCAQSCRARPRGCGRSCLCPSSMRCTVCAPFKAVAGHHAPRPTAECRAACALGCQRVMEGSNGQLERGHHRTRCQRLSAPDDLEPVAYLVEGQKLDSLQPFAVAHKGQPQRPPRPIRRSDSTVAAGYVPSLPSDRGCFGAGLLTMKWRWSPVRRSA